MEVEQKHLDEQQRMEKAFYRNIKISSYSEIPLARWAYDGAKTSIDCFVKNMEKEGVKDLFDFNIKDCYRILEKTKDLLRSICAMSAANAKLTVLSFANGIGLR